MKAESPAHDPAAEIIGYQCDGCGLWDIASNFPETGTQEYFQILAEFGVDPENDSVGWVCPGCGNTSSFDPIREREELPH